MTSQGPSKTNTTLSIVLAVIALLGVLTALLPPGLVDRLLESNAAARVQPVPKLPISPAGSDAAATGSTVTGGSPSGARYTGSVQDKQQVTPAPPAAMPLPARADSAPLVSARDEKKGDAPGHAPVPSEPPETESLSVVPGAVSRSYGASPQWAAPVYQPAYPGYPQTPAWMAYPPSPPPPLPVYPPSPLPVYPPWETPYGWRPY